MRDDTQPKRRGRPPQLDPATDLSDEARGFLWRKTALMGSESEAIRMLAREDFCPAPLKAYIEERSRSRCGRFAPSLHRACKTPSTVLARIRGPKAMEYDGYSARRSREEILEDGRVKTVEPGDWWVFDDMSWNQPFWFNLPKGFNPEEADFPPMEFGYRAYQNKGTTRNGTGDKLAAKFGVAMGRQSLIAMDHASGRFIGVQLVARPKDAYRVSDILSFFESLIDTYGLPRRGIRIERGIWNSRAIMGVGGNDGAFSEAEQAEYDAGIRALGLEIDSGWTSRHKGELEGGFAHLQKVAAGLLEHLPNIGKTRGEMERETKRMMRCKYGVEHPRDAGFPFVQDMVDEVNKVMDYCNAAMKRGDIQSGIPEERWTESLQAAPLRRLDPVMRWVFAPDAAEVTIREGVAAVQVDGKKIRFGNPEEFALLGNGYRVALRYHADAPERGAYIFNREIGARSFHGYPVGALICKAELDELAPQFGGGGSDYRQRWNSSAQTYYSATGCWKRRVNVRREADATEERSVTVGIELASTPAPVKAAPPAATGFVDPLLRLMGGAG